MREILTKILQKVRKTIIEHALIAGKEKILVAMSGGPDSVFLAYILRELGYKIALVHVNYELRGEESAADEILVRNYAEKWQIPVFIKKIDTLALIEETKESMQVLARNIRYDFFEEIMDKHLYNYCAIAHHADDQIENLLMSLLHGNSSMIWKGMPVKRECYIRPLIEVYRAEIMDGLKVANLEWRLDRSNQKTDYLRNKYRHEIVPKLEKIQPDAKQKLLTKIAWYDLQHQFIYTQISHWLEKSLTKTVEGELLNWETFEQTYGVTYVPLLLTTVLEKWGIHGHLLWECIRLQNSMVGKWVDTPEGKVVRSRKGLILMKDQSKENVNLEVAYFEGEKILTINKRKLQFKLPEEKTPEHSREDCFYLDADKVEWPLNIRTWKQGDKMQPLGMRNRKKLSDIFVDEKFTSLQKKRAIIITDQSEIICLSEFRIAEKVKIRKNSQRILSIQVLDI